MKKTLRPGSHAVQLHRRALGAVRPGVEAALLVAVALGCAQTGWSVLAPPTAGAAGAPPADDSPTERLAADMRSPFAPAASQNASNAAAALAASIKLSGVRMSDDPARSGAVLTLDSGAQRAFAVGQEISAGVRLSEVRADYVVLAFAGGQTQVSMDAPPSYSFARALMGQPQAAGASAPATLAAAAEAARAAAPTQAAALAPAAGTVRGPTAEESAWLVGALGAVERQAGQPAGWRIDGPVPTRLAEAGVISGDLILSVNGAGPGDVAAALSAVGQSRVEIALQRGDERINVTLAGNEGT